MILQTDEIVSQPPPSCVKSDQHGEEKDEQSELVEILNPKRIRNDTPAVIFEQVTASSSSLDLDQPKCVFETITPSKPKSFLDVVPTLTLFSQGPMTFASNFSASDEETDLDSELRKIKKLTADHLASFQFSQSDESQSSDDEPILPKPISSRKQAVQKTTDDSSDTNEEYDDSSELSSDPQAIIRRLTRGDPELLKYLDLAAPS
jgi:hypothetical protein